MTPAHLDAVMQIQADCYPTAMQECRELVQARLHAAPAQCWVAQDSHGVCAYLFGYRSRRGRVTPLNGAFQPQAQADCLYLHDLAVARRAGGRRIGPQLIARSLAEAQAVGLQWTALVSVQDSAPFWRRQGYRDGEPADARQRSHLLSYPAPALYMERALG